MNLYELKKAGAASLPPLSPETYIETFEEVETWLSKLSSTKTFVLLSWDENYLTIFTPKEKKSSLINGLKDCLNTLGLVQAVDYGANQSSLVFWIDGKMYILAPYDKGVVYYS